MVNRMQFYIDGAWVDPAVKKPRRVVNPATEEACIEVALGSKADVDKAVAAARRAFETFSQTTPRGARRAARARSSRSTRRRMTTSPPPSPRRWARRCGSRRSVAGRRRPRPPRIDAAKCSKNYRVRGDASARRVIVREPIGVMRHDHAVELADEPDRLQGRARARRRLHDGAEAVARSRRSTRSSSPRSCMRRACPRASSTWSMATGPTVGAAMSRASRHRHDVVHRLDPRRHRGGQGAPPTVKRVSAGARRQVGQHHARRRRPRQGGDRRRDAHVQQLGPVLQRADAHVRAARRA